MNGLSELRRKEKPRLHMKDMRTWTKVVTKHQVINLNTINTAKDIQEYQKTFYFLPLSISQHRSVLRVLWGNPQLDGMIWFENQKHYWLKAQALLLCYVKSYAQDTRCEHRWYTAYTQVTSTRHCLIFLTQTYTCMYTMYTTINPVDLL